MVAMDDSGDGRVSFQEFVDSVIYKTNSKGQSTAHANALVRLVAKTFVKKSDDTV